MRTQLQPLAHPAGTAAWTLLADPPLRRWRARADCLAHLSVPARPSQHSCTDITHGTAHRPKRAAQGEIMLLRWRLYWAMTSRVSCTRNGTFEWPEWVATNAFVETSADTMRASSGCCLPLRRISERRLNQRTSMQRQLMRRRGLGCDKGRWSCLSSSAVARTALRGRNVHVWPTRGMLGVCRGET